MNPKLKRIFEYLDLKGIAPTRADMLMKSGNGRLGKMSSNNTIPKDNFIEKFLDTFTDANGDYINNGDGDIIKQPDNFEVETSSLQIIQDPLEGYIPVYDITFTLGFTPTFLDSMNTPEILGYSNFPELRGSKYVVRGKGNSMAPFICDGDFVGIRPVKNRNIIDYGNPYGIITEDYAIFKRIKKAKDSQNLKLVSDNDKEHEDWEVPRGEIIHLFIVVGVLSVKSVTY